MITKTTILGVGITSATRQEVLEYVLFRLSKKKKFAIVTPNPEIVTYATKHEDYRSLLNTAEISLADGVGLFFAAKILGKPLKSRLTGTDFIEELCLASKEKALSMGFLGGRGNVAERAAERLREKYPWVRIVFAGEDWFREGEKEKGRKGESMDHFAIAPFRQIDILFVAFGFPNQEQWIFENLEKLPVTAAMGVGGAFDFISGDIPRAPHLLRSTGLEWLFRLVIQPWRIKRQFALLTFIFLVFRERWGYFWSKHNYTHTRYRGR